MSKEIFDFSEALKRMKEGKKVCRNSVNLVHYFIDGGKIAISRNETIFHIPYIPINTILATDWEEV